MLIANPCIGTTAPRRHAMPAPRTLHRRIQPPLAPHPSSRAIQLRKSCRHGHRLEEIARQIDPARAAAARDDDLGNRLAEACGGASSHAAEARGRPGWTAGYQCVVGGCGGGELGRGAFIGGERGCDDEVWGAVGEGTGVVGCWGGGDGELRGGGARGFVVGGDAVAELGAWFGFHQGLVF